MVKLRKQSVWTISGTVSASVAAAFLIWIVVADHGTIEDDWIAPGSEDSSSDRTSAAEESELRASSQSESEFDWPGLPAPPSDWSTGSQDVEPLYDIALEMEELSLAEQIALYPGADADPGGHAAMRIAGSWLGCVDHQRLDEQSMRDKAESLASVIELHRTHSIAVEEDAQVRDRRISALAAQDSASQFELQLENLKVRQHKCAFAEDFDNRWIQALEWARRAADSGHRGAMLDYAWLAFWPETVAKGNASGIAGRKRRVADYLYKLLAAGDGRVFMPLARISDSGHYHSPDSAAAYVYTRVWLALQSGGPKRRWRFPVPEQEGPGETRNISVSLSEHDLERYERALTPRQLDWANREFELILNGRKSL